MTTTQTVTLGGTTYTFTTEDQDLTTWIKTLGTLRNRRGDFVGLVCQETGKSHRVLAVPRSWQRWSNAEERAALATLDIPGA